MTISLIITFLSLALSVISMSGFSESYGFADYNNIYTNLVEASNNNVNHNSGKMLPGVTNIALNAPLPSKNDVSPAGLFNAVKDSVVRITVKGKIPNPQLLVNGTPVGIPFDSAGSGFIYDQDGHIVTNYHVVADANVISVRFLDGNIYPAKLVGVDKYSDLAVLQLEASAIFGEQPKPLPLANSSAIQVGEPVAAIGSPAGLTGSMTEGIVSQVNRIQLDPVTNRFFVGGLIQTDASITHGSSGGPLLNMKGEVVGVTERVFPDTTSGSSLGYIPGISYAISAGTLQNVIPQLIQYHHYRYPWLGIHVVDVTPDIAQHLSLGESKGVEVVSVTPGSPADLAGMKGIGTNYTASVILRINDTLVKQRSDLINYVQNKIVGQTVILGVLESDGLVHGINLRLGERPQGNSLNSGGYTGTLASMTSNNVTSFLSQLER